MRVFGLDPVSEPVSVLSRLGYLSEDRDLPDWMRLHEMIRYLRAFYPDVGRRVRRGASAAVRSRSERPIKTLSQGQRARAGLLAALAFRPELLVLDEPSTGLDPIVRKEILSAIIRTIAQEGRTVLFSSHLLDEVERVSDHVALIDRGQIVLRGLARRDQVAAPSADAAVRRAAGRAAGAPGLDAVGRVRPRVDGRSARARSTRFGSGPPGFGARSSRTRAPLLKTSSSAAQASAHTDGVEGP